MAIVTSLADQPAYTITKKMQTDSKPQKPSQKQLGAISKNVDTELKERSGGICEVRKKCVGVQATERAHTMGRRIIPHKTSVEDLFHSCGACHRWLDRDPKGIKFCVTVRKVGTTKYLQKRGGAQWHG